MLNVRQVVLEANRNIGNIQDGEELDDVNTSVSILNELVASMNTENFFASQQIIVRGTGKNKTDLTIGPKQFDEQGQPLPDEEQPDIEAERPQNIIQLYAGARPQIMAGRLAQVSLADMPLFQCGYGYGMPSRFAYESTYPLGRIVFDLPFSSQWWFAICYCKQLPKVTINDELPIPPEYQPALTWMLAKNLCVRYMLPNDVYQRVEKTCSEFVHAIKQNSHMKTPIHAYMDDGIGGTIINRW